MFLNKNKTFFFFINIDLVYVRINILKRFLSHLMLRVVNKFLKKKISEILLLQMFIFDYLSMSVETIRPVSDTAVIQEHPIFCNKFI